MQRVVLDTNVVLSGMLTHFGPAAVILGLVLNRRLLMAIDDRILDEYDDILSRPRFNIPRRDIVLILERLSRTGLAAVPQAVPGGKKGFPDPSDIMFLELALGAQVECLITRNLRHFPPHRCAGIRIATPEQVMGEVSL